MVGTLSFGLFYVNFLRTIISYFFYSSSDNLILIIDKLIIINKNIIIDKSDLHENSSVLLILQICYLFVRPSILNDNDDNSSESGSEGSSSMDSSSDDDGSKNEPPKESITNWSLSTFVKPDPKPVEKLPSLTVPQIKIEVTGYSSNNMNTDETAKKKSYISPKCLTNEQIKQEPIGNCFYIHVLLFGSCIEFYYQNYFN